MKRIILSLILIAGAGAVIIGGSTGAFFSDTEKSTGNTFAAGAIDLKVDNESYYNMNACVPNPSVAPEAPKYIWQGNAAYPVPGTECSTSWELSDLGNGLLFFNFQDLKPDDEGEDTISLHVNNNDAYACMDVSLTSNDDNSTTEPEGLVDVPEDNQNTWDGELAENIQMFWWADDGDNVYETGENSISDGVRSLYNLATSSPYSVALADSENNVWATTTPGPIPGDTTVYLAKAWCFGNLTLDPVAQDNQGHLPNSANGPQVRGTGVVCDGKALGNLTQSDGTTLDVAFRAVQARHNTSYVCNNEKPRMAKITVVKQIVNNNGGNNVVSDFLLYVFNGVVSTPVTSGVTTDVVPGTYSVGETGVSGYQAIYSGDCNVDGDVTLAEGEEKTCYITNDDLPANIHLIKVVTGSAPLANPADFKMRVDGVRVPNNNSVATSSNATHLITEDTFTGYHFVSITGADCPATIPGNVTLNEGQEITCTITNAKD